MNALVRFGLLTAACCCLAMPGLAQVGVTTAASGEPRGTPPALPERVLRVGIDVQVNERIMTRNSEQGEILWSVRRDSSYGGHPVIDGLDAVGC